MVWAELIWLGLWKSGRLLQTLWWTLCSIQGREFLSGWESFGLSEITLLERMWKEAAATQSEVYYSYILAWGALVELWSWDQQNSKHDSYSWFYCEVVYVSCLKANHVFMMGNPISGKISRFYSVPTRGHLFTMLRSLFWHLLTKFSTV